MAQQTSAPDATDHGGHPHEADTPARPRQVATAGRVPLDRLLTVVVLSPAQAVLVASRLLGAAGTSATPDAADPIREPWEVLVTSSGEVEVVRPTTGRGAPVPALLGLLVHNARQLPAHPAPAQLALLRCLEEVASDEDTRAGARRLDRALAEHLGATTPDRLVTDLAGLVGAFAHVASSTTAPAESHVALRGLRTDARRSPRAPPPTGPAGAAPAPATSYASGTPRAVSPGGAPRASPGRRRGQRLRPAPRPGRR